MSWLKKNELDLKRHVNEFRDSIRQNWSTTGQELSREIRQFWQSNTGTHSPVRSLSPFGRGNNNTGITATSQSKSSSTDPNHLDIPRLDTSNTSGNGNDFAAGYVLGLIGGVRSWVCIDIFICSFRLALPPRRLNTRCLHNR